MQVTYILLKNNGKAKCKQQGERLVKMDGYLQRKRALIDLNEGRLDKYGNDPK